jgi:hypothetical protein
VSRIEKLLAFVLLAGVAAGVVRALWRIAEWVWFYREAFLTVYAVAFAIGLVTLVPVVVVGGIASLAGRERWQPAAEEEDQWATPFRVSHPRGTFRARNAAGGGDHG